MYFYCYLHSVDNNIIFSYFLEEKHLIFFFFYGGAGGENAAQIWPSFLWECSATIQE